MAIRTAPPDPAISNQMRSWACTGYVLVRRLVFEGQGRFPAR